MDELKWIQAAKQGDSEAFCRLYGLYKDRLYRYAYYRLGTREDAEDAVSECVLSAWQQIGALRVDKAFPAWLFRILSGCCGKAIRRNIADRESAEVAEGAEAVKAAEAAEAAVFQPSTLRLELEEALGLLTEQEREIVLMAVVAGLKSPQIADATGLTAGSVRSKLSRSLTKMRRYLEGDE